MHTPHPPPNTSAGNQNHTPNSGRELRNSMLSAFRGNAGRSCSVIAFHVLQKAGHDADGGAKDVQELWSKQIHILQQREEREGKQHGTISICVKVDSAIECAVRITPLAQPLCHKEVKLRVGIGE